MFVYTWMSRCDNGLSSLVALVNKGNCLFSSGQYDKARDYYQEALRYVVDVSQHSNTCVHTDVATLYTYSSLF